MDISDGLYQYLAGKTLLTALIGSPPSLYPEIAPQNCQRPFVVFQQPECEREIHLGGASNIGEFYVTFDIYSDDVADRQSIGEALRNLLHTRGNVLLTDSSSNTARLENSILKRDYTSAKFPPDGSEESVFCRTMAFEMQIREVVPTLP